MIQSIAKPCFCSSPQSIDQDLEEHANTYAYRGDREDREETQGEKYEHCLL
jgi:hypothetical protein